MATSGIGDDGDAIGEYCAEMTGNPVYMIAEVIINISIVMVMRRYYLILKMTRRSSSLSKRQAIKRFQTPLPKR